MSAQFHGRLLHAIRAQAQQLLADGCRTGQRHLAHNWRFNKLLRDASGVARHQIDCARRNAGIVACTYNGGSTSRGLTGGLQDH